jgi:hypothetical protein
MSFFLLRELRVLRVNIALSAVALAKAESANLSATLRLCVKLVLQRAFGGPPPAPSRSPPSRGGGGRAPFFSANSASSA